MKPSKIALLSLGGVVAGAIVVAAMVARVAIGWDGQARAQLSSDPGEMTTVSHELSGFSEIEINGSWNVTATQGEEWQVDLSYPENFPGGMDVAVNGERLSLDGAETRSFFGRSNSQFAAEIVMPALVELDAAGNSRVTLSGFEGEQLTIDAAGANRITGEDGRYGELELSIAGANDIRLAGFTFTDADVDLAGASNLNLTMDGGELTGNLAGAGKIEYFGTVSRESVDVAGFGSVGPGEL